MTEPRAQNAPGGEIRPVSLLAHSWRKSSYSSDGSGNCVETQPTGGGHMAIRDSKNRPLGAHLFTRAAWQTFVSEVRDSRTGR
ncbi:DUF397 domain-containing protein [Streptomyces sp. NPDC007088]|uniref:DUF397 domain-containing protein n=1 Tax=Streptomyces sp. NPDC007088 TaxID=3364773 RepID=UPI0036A393CE